MKKNNIGKKVVLVIICIVLIAIIGVFYLWDRKEQKEISSNSIKANTEASSVTENWEISGVTDELLEENASIDEVSEDSVAEDNSEKSKEETSSASTTNKASKEEKITYIDSLYIFGDDFDDQVGVENSWQNLLFDQLQTRKSLKEIERKTVTGYSSLSEMNLAGVQNEKVEEFVSRNYSNGNNSYATDSEYYFKEFNDEEKARTTTKPIPVIMMGYNGGWNADINELIEQQKEVLSVIKNDKDQYLIIGILPANNCIDMQTYVNAMKAAWGDHFIMAETASDGTIISADTQKSLVKAIIESLEDLKYISKES